MAADIEIYTISGLKVVNAVDTDKVSIENLAKGVYVLKCKSDYGTKVLKFVK